MTLSKLWNNFSAIKHVTRNHVSFPQSNSAEQDCFNVSNLRVKKENDKKNKAESQQAKNAEHGRIKKKAKGRKEDPMKREENFM